MLMFKNDRQNQRASSAVPTRQYLDSNSGGGAWDSYPQAPGWASQPPVWDSQPPVWDSYPPVWVSQASVWSSPPPDWSSPPPDWLSKAPAYSFECKGKGKGKGKDKGKGKGQDEGKGKGQDEGKGKGQDEGKGKGQGKSQDDGKNRKSRRNEDELVGSRELALILGGNATVYCPWYVKEVLNLLNGNKMVEDARIFSKKIYEFQTNVSEHTMDQTQQRGALKDLYISALKLLLAQADADPNGKQLLQGQCSESGSGSTCENSSSDTAA